MFRLMSFRSGLLCTRRACAGFDRRFSRRQRLSMFSGGHGGGAIPDPIPNSEVKPSCANGTAGVTLWESRTLPDLCPGHASVRGYFFGSAHV